MNPNFESFTNLQMDSTSVDKIKAKVVSEKSKTLKKKNAKIQPNVANSMRAKNGLKRRKRFYRKGRGVIYLSHIPHGFYEDEMRAYFSQFGKVRETSVIRSKRTGQSRGYGFVEFDDEDVAKIAAETMNNYLMFNRILKCRYIPPEERKGKMVMKPYITGDYQRKKNRVIDSKNKAKALSNLTQNAYFKKTQKKLNQFKKFFEGNGIDFNFKISMEKSQNNQTNKRNKTKTESKDEESNEIGILEIDESDLEISFKTPPQVKKVIKKSCSSSTETIKKPKSEKLSKGKKGKLKEIKKSVEKKTKKNESIKKKIQKTKLSEKLKSKPDISKKLTPSKKSISNPVKLKNSKALKSISLTLTKKEPSIKLEYRCSNNSVSKKAK